MDDIDSKATSENEFPGSSIESLGRSSFQRKRQKSKMIKEVELEDNNRKFWDTFKLITQ